MDTGGLVFGAPGDILNTYWASPPVRPKTLSLFCPGLAPGFLFHASDFCLELFHICNNLVLHTLQFE